jgi:outer membrane protein OmpA-like peptidoglycan-associated protein
MLIKNTLFKTPLKSTPTAFLTGLRSALIMSSALSVSLSASAEWWDEMDGYVGVGVGQSYLSPHHVTNQGYSVEDHTQAAWKLTGGWDINDYVSVEGYYGDIGSTGLSPEADIGYRMAGADAIFHYWAKGEERILGSIALYAKAGLNYTNTYHSSNVEEHDGLRKLFGGLGAEVYLPQKFSVRFEFESYNADASLLSLNLVKRFGFNSKTSTQKEFVAMVEQLPETAAGPKVVVLIPVVLDSDLDGLLDDEDQCPDTAKDTAVDEFGCVNLKGNIDGVISNVQFDSNSDRLTQASKLGLDNVANLLVTSTAVNVEVQAHSDNTGSARYNKNLSQKRAESVVSYLVEKGVAADRMSAMGYGEEKPVADNNTTSGRAKNRRVEFILTTH